jgi:protein-tyrosine kinase
MSRIKDALKKARVSRCDSQPESMTTAHIVTPDGKPVTGTSQTKTINYSEFAVKKHKIITPYFENIALIEYFKLLRTKLLSERHISDDRTILVTSTLRNEGKTFVTLNLAVTVAREVDQTVLVVDTNNNNPSTLRAFGIRAEKGLTDYLLDGIPLSEVLICPGIEKLIILPFGRHVENSAELLRSKKMGKLVEEMKYRYSGRYLFFDAPAVLSSVDTIVLSKHIDKTLFVIEAGRTAPEQVSEALDLLGEEKILGTILNKKNITKK